MRSTEARAAVLRTEENVLRDHLEHLRAGQQHVTKCSQRRGVHLLYAVQILLLLGYIPTSPQPSIALFCRELRACAVPCESPQRQGRTKLEVVHDAEPRPDARAREDAYA